MQQNDIRDQWTIRAPRKSDVVAMAKLFNACTEYYDTGRQHTAESLLAWWDQSSFDPKANVRIVVDESGDVIGWADLFDVVEPYLKMLFTLAPHPRSFECEPLWDTLADEVLKLAQGHALKAPEGAQPILRTFCLLRDKEKCEALRRNGFEAARVQNKMRIDLSTPPLQPVWPASVALEPFEFDRDVGRVVAAYQEAFRDHWGIVELPYENEVAKWRDEHAWEGEEYDAGLWYKVMDGGEVAGFARWWAQTNGDSTCGYLYNFFVRRPWRKRGLGTAILSHAVCDLHRRGYKAGELHVDSESLTDAPRVYERVGFRLAEQQYIFQKEIPR